MPNQIAYPLALRMTPQYKVIPPAQFERENPVAPHVQVGATPYKGFESIIHYYVSKHGPEVAALMQTFGYSDGSSPRSVAKAISQSPSFAEAFKDMIDLIDSANGYDDYNGVQYEGHDDIVQWIDEKLDSPTLKGKKYDCANGSFDPSGLFQILGGAVGGIGEALARKKQGGGNSQAAPPPPPKPKPNLFSTYKTYIIGGVVLLVGIVVVVIVTRKKS